MTQIRYLEAPKEVYEHISNSKPTIKGNYTRDLQIFKIDNIPVAYANSDRPCTLHALNREQLEVIYKNEKSLISLISKHTKGKPPEKLLVACMPGISISEGPNWRTPEELNRLYHFK